MVRVWGIKTRNCTEVLDSTRGRTEEGSSWTFWNWFFWEFDTSPPNIIFLDNRNLNLQLRCSGIFDSRIGEIRKSTPERGRESIRSLCADGKSRCFEQSAHRPPILDTQETFSERLAFETVSSKDVNTATQVSTSTCGGHAGFRVGELNWAKKRKSASRRVITRSCCSKINKFENRLEKIRSSLAAKKTIYVDGSSQRNNCTGAKVLRPFRGDGLKNRQTI